MSHLVLTLALSAALACGSSKPAEPPAEVPDESPPAVEGVESAGTAGAGGEPAHGGPPSASPAPASAQGVTQTLFVASEVVSCEGEAPQKCLLVRSSEAEPFRRLYSGIAGFEHEPSYEYELKVEATPVPDAPADASSVRYRLLEVVAKRKVPAASK